MHLAKILYPLYKIIRNKDRFDQIIDLVLLCRTARLSFYIPYDDFITKINPINGLNTG